MEDVAAKLLKAPLVTVISSSAKSVVASLDMKVSDSVASLDVNPSAPSAEVIVIVGAMLSTTAKAHCPALVSTSLAVIVLSTSFTTTFSHAVQSSL